MICYCGHTQDAHRTDNANDGYCSICWDKISGHDDIILIGFEYVYHRFKADNLRYLESLA